jgi:hypothetical protein
VRTPGRIIKDQTIEFNTMLENNNVVCRNCG